MAPATNHPPLAPTSPTPIPGQPSPADEDPVAFCGMAGCSTDELPAATPTHPESKTATNWDPEPLRFRIWTRYCAGNTQTSIAQELGIDRQTVARHVRAVQDLLAAEQRESAALERTRAVEAQFAILSATWSALYHEDEREAAAYGVAPMSSTDPGAPINTRSAPPAQPAGNVGSRARAPYRAQRARLLAIALRAASTAARLQGLYNRSSFLADDPVTPPSTPADPPSPTTDSP